jgi:hypothetical protein
VKVSHSDWCWTTELGDDAEDVINLAVIENLSTVSARFALVEHLAHSF